MKPFYLIDTQNKKSLGLAHENVRKFFKIALVLLFCFHPIYSKIKNFTNFKLKRYTYFESCLMFKIIITNKNSNYPNIT